MDCRVQEPSVELPHPRSGVGVVGVCLSVHREQKKERLQGVELLKDKNLVEAASQSWGSFRNRSSLSFHRSLGGGGFAQFVESCVCDPAVRLDGAGQVPALGEEVRLSCCFLLLLTSFDFQNSFHFIEKLYREYRVYPSTPCPTSLLLLLINLFVFK